VSPATNWSGFYIGAMGGYGKENSSDPLALKGGFGGGTVGYNWQFGQFVYGVEGDIDWTNINGNSAANGSVGCFGNVCTTNNHFLSTVRGRAGVAIDRWLPYVTGGLAIGNIETTTPFSTGATRPGQVIKEVARNKCCFSVLRKTTSLPTGTIMAPAIP